MLLWSVLHLTGTQAVNAEYERLGKPSVTLDDIRHFRQLDSKAPGHPEYHWVSGVETTTGPLGQGIATSVGMAIAREVARQPLQPARLRDLRLQHLRGLRRRLPDGGRRLGGGLARRPSRPRQPVLDLRQQPHHDRRQHAASPSPRTSRRASSATAGTCCGSATPTISSASSTRWTVFRKTKGRPTLIILDSHIGYGSPHKQDTAAAHGEPLGEDEVRLTKRAYGWPEDAKFLVPDGVCEHFDAGIGARGAEARAAVGRRCSPPTAANIPELATEIDQMQRRELPAGWDRNLPVFPADPKGHRRPRCLGQGAERAGAEHPVVPRRLGGSRAVEQDDAEIRGRRRLPGRTARAARICISASASTPWRRS